MKNTVNTLTNAASIALICVLISACGSSSTRDYTSNGLNNTNTNTSTNTGTGTGTGTGTNLYNLPNAPTYDAKLSAPTGSTASAVSFSQSVYTSHTLKVKVIPQPAPAMLVSPGWVVPYDCYSVTVRVPGDQKSTIPLRVAGVTVNPNSPCANAPTSQILDFSNSMTGSGNVTVTVDTPQTDNCRNSFPYYLYAYLYYGSIGSSPCSVQPTWKDHMTDATVQIQYDGTWMDP